MPHYGRIYTESQPYYEKRPSRQDYFWQLMLSLPFRAGWWVLKHTWVTVLWLSAFWLLSPNEIHLALLLAVLGGLILLSASQADTKLGRIAQYLLPVRSEYLQARQRKEIQRGNTTLRRLELVHDTDPTTYKGARHTRKANGVSTLTVSAQLASLTDETTVRETVEAHLAAVPAADCDVKKLGTGTYRITFYDGTKPDPLANLPALTHVPTATDVETLPYGYDAEGNPAFFSLKETSGIVVGGLPGGGKTAGLTSLLAPLVHVDSVQFVVFDGKGGSDWSWLKSRASIYNNDDEDLATVSTQLEALVDIMRYRLQELPIIRGGSSIWNTGGPTQDFPLIVTIVDECQTYLDKSNFSRDDKDGLAYRQRIEAALANLVRKGRSVGMATILATQKPTADSIPTTIGANASKNIGFRVKTAESEKAIFGSAPAPEDPTATELPTKPGYAVIGSEDGSREIVRFFYLPESLAADHAQNFAHLTQRILPDTN